MKSIFYAALFIFSLSAVAQETTSLRINLKKGDTYEITTVQKFYGSVMKNKTNFETLVVKDVVDDTYEVEMTINKIVANYDQMGMKVHYDSSADVAQMSQQEKGLHSQFKSGLRTVISEKVSKTGESSNRKTVKGGKIAQTAEQKTNFLELPAEPIKVGSKWTKQTTQNDITTIKKYTVSNITDTKVYINLEAIMKKPYIGHKAGEMIGSIELDKETGVPLKKNIKVYMSAGNKKAKVAEVTIIIQKV